MHTKESVRELRIVAYAALVLAIIGSVVAVATFLHVQNLYGLPSVGQPTQLTVSGALIVPPTMLADAPVITAKGQPGNRLTNINAPFSREELLVINNASTSFFITAAQMFLNNSIANRISPDASPVTRLVVNGKPSVVYLGAISCIFCGENRWAMALALSRFGSFSQLFKGYSAIGDGDVPTIYWRPAGYNATSAVDFGDFYDSTTINFLSIEYASQITLGFQMQPLSSILHQAQLANNQPYVQAIAIIINANNYQGTPYTIWGGYAATHANAVIFGNSSSASAANLAALTHGQVLNELDHPHDQFGWSEYAAADAYIALLCASLRITTGICGAPVIQQIQIAGGF
jgi:hypothetical protein